MKMRNLTGVIATLSIISLLSTSVSAGVLGNSFALSEDDSHTIEMLKMRYRTQTIRPLHCPMESTSYSEIATKLNNIKQILFECSEDKGLIEQIGTQTEEIQTSIDRVREARGDEVSTDEDTSGLMSIAQINGKSVSDITSIINSALKSKECRDTLNSQSFLAMTAETILNLSQLGLLIPNANGIIVSAGGAVIGSIIKLIDTLLNRGYDFEKAEDRNAFIKINCAFYDLRRELEEGDAFKVYARENERDLEEAKNLMSSINNNIEALNKEYKDQLASVKRFLQADLAIMDEEVDELRAEAAEIETQVNAEKAKLLKGISGLDNLKKLIDEQINVFSKPAVTVSEDDPAVSQMIYKLYTLELVAPVLIQKLKEYTPLSSSKGQDRILIRFLEKLDYDKNEEDYLALQIMEVEKFNNVFRARLLAGMKRVSKDIGKKQGEVDQLVAKKMDKLTQKKNEITALENSMMNEAATSLKIDGEKVSTILKELESDKAKTMESLHAQTADLKVISEKLNNYIRSESTREDEGTSSRIDMSDDFNAIANNIYGINGYKFLMQSQESSEIHLETFNRMFDTFANNFLVQDEETWYIPTNLSKEMIRRGCQDGKPFIRKFTAARDWKELGYDFLATNADLFHGYKIDGFIMRSKKEKIQKEHKAVIFTRQSMKDEEVPEEMEKYVGTGYGKLLQEIEEAGNKAALIQRFIHENDCNKIIEMK